MRTNHVRTLLMGGQACVLYGAAEFSRDTDLAVLCDDENMARLKAALNELHAVPIAVPPFEGDYLRRGHAVHFRCQHPEASGLRVDLMSVMRGVDRFDAIWERRTTMVTSTGEEYDLLSLPDLVQAKKTQRDKDWPMLRRLVETHYFAHRGTPTAQQIDFWFRELRTAELLIELAGDRPEEFAVWQDRRAPVAVLSRALDAQASDAESICSWVEEALDREEQVERDLDKAYWQPLKAELEALRHPRAAPVQNEHPVN